MPLASLASALTSSVAVWPTSCSQRSQVPGARRPQPSHVEAIEACAPDTARASCSTTLDERMLDPTHGRRPHLVLHSSDDRRLPPRWRLARSGCRHGWCRGIRVCCSAAASAPRIIRRHRGGILIADGDVDEFRGAVALPEKRDRVDGDGDVGRRRRLRVPAAHIG